MFLLSNKETTIIEYAAFFGAIQIFSYLLSKGANLTERIWLYAIHSDSIELINFIQNNCSYVIPYSYIDCIKEAIACHHNQLFDHFLKLENKNKNDQEIFDIINSYVFNFFNYLCYQDNNNYQLLFFYACEFDHRTFLDLLINEKKIDLYAKYYSNKTVYDIALEKKNRDIAEYLSEYFDNQKPNEKIYINVPFKEKDFAKSYGASYDRDNRMWYYTNPDDSFKFEKWKIKSAMSINDLSDEQQELIRLVKERNNVLVDACIGSGKTTTIQVLCNELPERQILYLTYNRLLKIDAKSKIQNKNTFVQNFHGFAFSCLKKNNIKIGGKSDLIQTFLKNTEQIKIQPFNLLLIDEYQDIEKKTAEMLEYIKLKNPNIQIVAVGDMEQKIYDKTILDVSKFIKSFLGTHKKLNFTRCFRLNNAFAQRLGMVWNKEIVGVNDQCEVKFMLLNEIEEFIKDKNTSDILVLGSRNGSMATLLNNIEEKYPNKFNKKTVYASISDEDRRDKIFNDNNVAIFTTFDSSKGLERKICIIFDYTEEYWKSRSTPEGVKYTILRNIFCVAASRGKNQIIFEKSPEMTSLKESTIATPFQNQKETMEYFMSEMFQFKYKEHIEQCFKLLNIEIDKTAKIEEIPIPSSDDQIDLSPCIGILQEASYFDGYDIDHDIQMMLEYKYGNRHKLKCNMNAKLEKKVLYLVSLDTRQNRYALQVETPFVSDEKINDIHKRMSEVFTRNEEVQVECRIPFIDNGKEKCLFGCCDVLKDDTVWELKFTSELDHEHYLQCACYMVALSKPKGVIWNIRTNERAFITIPDRQKFMESVINAKDV